jgi:hypothetical protein
MFVFEFDQRDIYCKYIDVKIVDYLYGCSQRTFSKGDICSPSKHCEGDDVQHHGTEEI